jgi:hypothetical protein
VSQPDGVLVVGVSAGGLATAEALRRNGYLGPLTVLGVARGTALATRVVVVGDGVLGAEIAATTRNMGLAVTMAGPQEAPLAYRVPTPRCPSWRVIRRAAGSSPSTATAVRSSASSAGTCPNKPVCGARLSGAR